MTEEPTPRPPRPSRSRGRAPGTGTTVTPDTPPRDTPPGPGAADSPPAPRARAPRKPVLQAKLEEVLSAPAMLYALRGDQYPVDIINTRAPVMAEAWYELSKSNPAVKRILERLTESGAWGAVIMSSAAYVYPLLGHHGVVPDVDPFANFYPAVAAGDGSPPSRGPIVPPPPDPADGAPDMTPPLAPTEPPGVVTVAGTNNNAA